MIISFSFGPNAPRIWSDRIPDFSIILAVKDFSEARPDNMEYMRLFHLYHCGLKVSRFQAKIDENFANYFLEIKANKCFIGLKGLKTFPVV